MKRKLIILVVTIVLIIASLCCLSACNRKKSTQKGDNISRITECYYAGESEIFAVTVEKGRREKNFIADGKATDVQDFALLTITPLKTNDFEEITYVLNGENATLEGSVKKSDYGEYVTQITLDFVPTSVTLTAGETSETIALASVLDGALTPEDVIGIAREEFKDALDKEATTGKEREIYLKIITGDRQNYYYYVSFIGDGVDYLAVLIEPKTGKIVSKK